MSKNYPQRAQTTEKANVFKLELPGFNPDNVTIDEDTKSPRFLSSFAKGGMRRLDPYEKKIYYEHQAKLKEQARLKEQQKPAVIAGANTNLSRYLQEGSRGEVRMQGFMVDNLASAKEKMLAMNKKPIFENNNYGLSNPKKQKQKVFSKREGEQSINLDESMTDSTAKLVEKLVREDKTVSQTDPSYALSSDIAHILQIVKREEEKNRVSRELQAKIWDKVSRETEPRQEGSSRALAVQNERLKQQLKQSELRSSAGEADRKAMMKSLEASRSNYDALMLKCKDLEIAGKEQQANIEKITIALRECEGRLRKSESRCEHLEGKLQQVELGKTKEIAKFCSETAIENDLSGFLCESIENFTGKAVVRAKLVYQKDEWNASISNYLERAPFPAVLLLKSGKGNLFGAFTEGIESIRTTKLKEGGGFKPFRVFLFNGSARTLFPGDERGRQACGLSYHENYLRFGNNEIYFKNLNLGVMNFSASSLFGEKYFTIPRRHHLTGEESETVEISTFEVFEVFFQ